MTPHNHSRILALSVILSLGILLSCLMGCVGQQAVNSDNPAVQSTPGRNEVPGTPGINATMDSGPVLVTVSSVFKTSEIRGSSPIQGNVFVVANLTIKNQNTTTPFDFNEKSITITGGGPITQKLYSTLSNPLYWGSIPPQGSKTGEVVFGVKAATGQFTMRVVDDKGAVIFMKEYADLPSGAYEEFMPKDSSTGVTGTPGNDGKLDLIVHSALKTTKIKDSKPLPGNVYIVVNMTIKNLAETGEFDANDKTVDITGGGPMTQKIYDRLSNPFYWGSIPPQSSKTGEVVFGVKEDTGQFTLTLLDSQRKVIFTKPLGSIEEGPYSPSLDDPALLTNSNFTSVVASLDTLKKASQYTDAIFTFTYHDGCKSYTPEEFFRLKNGDCKDYATFLSYVLAQHGYDAKIVAFKYFKDGKRNGHVVTLVTDKDGAMYYLTTPDISTTRSITSVDNLLQKECARLGVTQIANYTIVPAGSQDTCVA